jgi:DNA-binding MarR family transcriptional regulator
MTDLESRLPEKNETAEQAKEIVALLPAVMRGLFRLDDDLATELPLAQLRVCSLLMEGPRSMSILSREVGVTLSAMTQIADRLERSRLVKRVPEGTDRRVRCLQLTPRGEHLMHRRDNERQQAAEAALRQLSPQARTELLKNLDGLLQACDAAANSRTSAAAHAAEKIGA